MASDQTTAMQRIAKKLNEEGRVHVDDIPPELNEALGELLARGWVEESGDWLTPGAKLQYFSDLDE